MIPSVFQYQNYREYLKHYYEAKKNQGEGFSYRIFARLADFKSPNFLKLVIDGKRSLSLDGIRKVAKAMDLDSDESKYFKILVLFNQAENATERLKYARELGQSKVLKQMHPIQAAQLSFFQNWYCIPIREMVGKPGFRDNPKWIASQLRPNITADEAREGFKCLVDLGLIQKKDGEWIQSNATISTGDEVQSASVAMFHRQMMELAGSSFDLTPKHNRDISGVTIFVSEFNFDRIKELIQNFRKALLAESEAAKADKGTVYHVGIQFFPVTETVIPKNDGESEPLRNVS